MELQTLNANNQADKLIEGWDSLIWTERFNTIGDFQLVTGDVQKFMTLLPEGTRVTLRESNIAMVVETHKIDRKKNSPQKLTITGRSFESILDRRVSIGSVNFLTNANSWTFNGKTPSDACWWMIDQICRAGVVDAADVFPSTMVLFPAPADYNTATGPVKVFDIPRQNLLTTALGFLQSSAQADPSTTPATPAVVEHGIRAVRPSPSGTAISIQIYTGTDRSGTVYYDATRELLDDGTYLFSKVGSSNVGYGLLQGQSAIMYEGASNPTGLDRRVTLIDAVGSGIVDLPALKNIMSSTLSEASETAMFDGNINPDISPYIYGVDYNLGDIVRLVGDYGLDEKARVTEYIRSESNTGYKAYPTLTSLRS